MSNDLKYMKGFKYQMVDSFHVDIDIHPPVAIRTDFATLSTHGLLILKKGCASDGPSGPTIDTPETIKGAFVHDELCKMIRYGLLDRSFKEQVDAAAYKVWIASGMHKERADLWMDILKQFDFYVDPKNKREVLIAP